MGVIARLPSALSDQIAAGEVVERPASVVKELLENALDAQARRVTVDVEAGGVSLVRVVDDGVGMSADDALLCLERHATSKIRAFEDLEQLASYGFRGEALPSIASVSRLVLRTRARGAEEACEVRVEGGGAPVTCPAGSAEGTTFEVRDLFYNVPARRKFLKATPTESAHVGDVVVEAALARHDVSLRLVRDGKVARDVPATADRAGRVAQIFPHEALARVDAERGALRVEAFLSRPERARAGATGLHLLVNGRPVESRPVARAVAQAYGSVLEPGRYPVGVVYLDLPAADVDVNVHPRKAEVRFVDARGLLDGVTRALEPSLARAFSLPVGGPFRSPGALLPVRDPAYDAQPWRGQADVSPAPPALLGADLPGLFDPGATRGDLGATRGADPAPRWASLRFLGQAHGTFLVCEGTDGLYVLDQHASAERVTFERLRRAHRGRTMASQRLLVPEIVPLAEREVRALAEREEDLASLGVEIRAAGATSVAVHAVPQLLARRVAAARLVEDLIAELARTRTRPFSDAVDLVLATLACHGSLRAGDVVHADEARALLEALDDVDFAGHCPHGRPVVLHLPKPELLRRVGR